MLYFSDGDGGSANRVVAYAVPPSGTLPGKVRWATPAGTYSDPHSITLHQRTGLLVVANRGMNETRLLRASDGADLGVLDCGFHFEVMGRRSACARSRAAAGTSCSSRRWTTRKTPEPADFVVDASGLDASGAAKSTCDVVQEIGIPTSYSGPHLLGSTQRRASFTPRSLPTRRAAPCYAACGAGGRAAHVLSEAAIRSNLRNT